MKRLSPYEVARRRVIQSFECSSGRFKLMANGKTFEVKFDDLLDVVQAVEMIMLKLTGKVIRLQFRPVIKNRQGLRLSKIEGGDYSLYTGKDQPMPATTVCQVTHQLVLTHYLRIEIDGNRWDNWFGRLDELVKCLYIVVREAQGDPFVPKPMAMVGVRGPVSLH